MLRVISAKAPTVFYDLLCYGFFKGIYRYSIFDTEQLANYSTFSDLMQLPKLSSHL